MVVGELGLDGSITGVRGALAMAIRARQDGFRGIIVPDRNAKEAALVEGISVYGVRHLKEVLEFLSNDFSLVPVQPQRQPAPPPAGEFADVRGQRVVKRALEIAAAGNHNCLIIGPPGTGKTMLAKRLPSILPPLTEEECLETTRIYGASHLKGMGGLITEPPFRSPHHSTSDVALAGGGPLPAPGEISLAHNGVLFLDELPEFRRSTIEVLRQPMEERKITIGRARGILELPASFLLVAAMNPCPCGYYGHPVQKCTCSKRSIQWYRRKISGPLLDRIDIQVRADGLTLADMLGHTEPEETSARIRQRVLKARAIQLERFRGSGIRNNALIPEQDLETFCPMEAHARKFLIRYLDENGLSPRSYSRILKMARTLADLKGAGLIELEHVAEAAHWRVLDQPETGFFKEKRKSAAS